MPTAMTTGNSLDALNILSTVTLTRWNTSYRVDASAGNIVVTLPSAVARGGQAIEFVRVDSTANTVSIVGAGAQTINGLASQPLTGQWNGLTVRSNGSNSVIVDREVSASTSQKINVTQAAHAFTVDNWLHFNGTAWVKAQADADLNCFATAGVVSSVTDANNFVLTTSGVFDTTGLTVGPQYLSDATAGASTAVEPVTSGSISKPLGLAISTTRMIVNVGRGVEVP
jgi:hypothetical protein